MKMFNFTNTEKEKLIKTIKKIYLRGGNNTTIMKHFEFRYVADVSKLMKKLGITTNELIKLKFNIFKKRSKERQIKYFKDVYHRSIGKTSKRNRFIEAARYLNVSQADLEEYMYRELNILVSKGIALFFPLDKKISHTKKFSYFLREYDKHGPGVSSFVIHRIFKERLFSRIYSNSDIREIMKYSFDLKPSTNNFTIIDKKFLDLPNKIGVKNFLNLDTLAYSVLLKPKQILIGHIKHNYPNTMYIEGNYIVPKFKFWEKPSAAWITLHAAPAYKQANILINMLKMLELSGAEITIQKLAHDFFNVVEEDLINLLNIIQHYSNKKEVDCIVNFIGAIPKRRKRKRSKNVNC